MRDGPQSCLSKGLPMDNHFSLQYCEDRGATAHVHALCAILIILIYVKRPDNHIHPHIIRMTTVKNVCIWNCKYPFHHKNYLIYYS